jgi:hypothetical protein
MSLDSFHGDVPVTKKIIDGPSSVIDRPQKHILPGLLSTTNTNLTSFKSPHCEYVGDGGFGEDLKTSQNHEIY